MKLIQDSRYSVQISTVYDASIPMDRWILKCPECKMSFTQSVVKPPFRLGELLYVWPPKPEFPDGGVRIECPNCKTASLYQRNQLTYATG